MEKKTADIKEALTFMFKGEKPLKIFYGLLFWLPAAFIGIILQNKWIGLGFIETIYLIISSIIIGVFVCAFCGYFVLYSHDRALDKNAVFRDWSECFWDAFFAGIKLYTGLICVMIILELAFMPVWIIGTIILALLAKIFPPLAFIIFIIALPIGIAVMAFLIIFFFKLQINFIKDLKLSSWFRWPTAFRISKKVKFGKLAILIGILLFIVYLATLFVPLAVLGIFQLGSTQIPVVPPLIILPAMLVAFYMSLYWNSVFGQTTYHAIEQNMGVEPETLPKEINKDKVVAIIIAIVVFTISILPSFFVPTLINRQNDIASMTKIKKAAASYEDIATYFKAQTNQQDLSAMMGANCQNAQTLFYIKQQIDGCNFVTQDGVYWQFNENDGSVVISDDMMKPKYSFKMGQCYDGSINCQYDYPEIYNFLHGGTQNMPRK